MPAAGVGLANSPWAAFGTSAAWRLVLDTEHCINCGECENACPWEAVYSIPGDPAASAEDRGVAVFMVEDHNCTRCGVCVQDCPTACLYFARLGDEAGTTRTMGVVPQQGLVA